MKTCRELPAQGCCIWRSAYHGEPFSRTSLIRCLSSDSDLMWQGTRLRRHFPIWLPSCFCCDLYEAGRTEEYRGFTFDNILHSESEGDIHFNLYVPDSYDGSEPYALFFTFPGYERLIFRTWVKTCTVITLMSREYSERRMSITVPDRPVRLMRSCGKCIRTRRSWDGCLKEKNLTS